MNSFESYFFQKYIPDGHKLLSIVHVHPIMIIGKIFIVMGLFVVIPSTLYYYSGMIQSIIPFYLFEIYLFILYAKIIYDIFDWYNDVWMITDEAIISLEWSLININTDSLSHEHIEGMGVEKNSVFDMIFKKGDLILHKFGDESYVLENAVDPYSAINLVESLGIEKDIPEEDDITSDRFKQILHALSDVVDKHAYESTNTRKMKTLEEDAEKQKKEYIHKIEKKDGTIDLRSEE